MAKFPADYFVSEHALEQLAERQIGLETIRAGLTQDGFMSDGYHGRMIFNTEIEKGGKSYLLRVVFDPVINPVRIITAYLTNKMKKYGEQT